MLRFGALLAAIIIWFSLIWAIGGKLATVILRDRAGEAAEAARNLPPDLGGSGPR